MSRAFDLVCQAVLALAVVALISWMMVGWFAIIIGTACMLVGIELQDKWLWLVPPIGWAVLLYVTTRRRR